MYAILNDGIKPATVSFADHKLPAMLAKYGTALTLIGGTTAQQPAAPGLSKLATWKQELLPAKPARKKGADARGGRRPDQGKALVCLTTGQYYEAIADAARAYELEQCSISAHLSRPDKHRQVKGYTFRLATPEEIAQKRNL